jgi:predicted transposase YbfD/YdcC
MDTIAMADVCARPRIGFLRFFQDMIDPRQAYNSLHRLSDMIVIAVLAVICGADGWVQVQMFGRAKQKWLSTFLELPNGIPAHDTFGRVFARLDPEVMEASFQAWATALGKTSGPRLVAIDGKSIRRSFKQAWKKSGMAHLVSALVCDDQNQTVFGQLAVDGKSNEITAIPKLLELLDIQGSVVTIDAMGCQKEVARKIVDKGGDYLLSVKENQPTLHATVKALLDEAALGASKGNAAEAGCGYYEEKSDAHGRLETRRIWAMNEMKWLGPELLEQWAGLGSIAMIERTRQNLGDTSGKVSVERHYYISSLKGATAPSIQILARSARGHWAVENNLHWQLDVSFREDERRIRVGHGAENFSRLSRLSLNLLKRDKTKKVGIHTKRLTAGWDQDYLLALING